MIGFPVLKKTMPLKTFDKLQTEFLDTLKQLEMAKSSDDKETILDKLEKIAHESRRVLEQIRRPRSE
jgi:hypothetical protein